MRNLKTEQIAAANYPLFQILSGICAGLPGADGGCQNGVLCMFSPIFMWTMQGCLR